MYIISYYQIFLNLLAKQNLIDIYFDYTLTNLVNQEFGNVEKKTY